MKAGVVVAEFLVEKAGNDVFAGVLLHQVKPPLPIDGAGHFLSRRQGAVAEMEDMLSLLLDIQHLHAAKDAHIAGLSAAFGIEGGLIQGDGPAFFRLFAAGDGGGKFS